MRCGMLREYTVYQPLYNDSIQHLSRARHLWPEKKPTAKAMGLFPTHMDSELKLGPNLLFDAHRHFKEQGDDQSTYGVNAER